MDVRCERCNARYTVDDGLVDEAGLAVRCSKCGNVFKVHRPARGLRVRNRAGEVFPLADAAMLQRWVVEGRVARDDEVSSDGGAWIQAGEIQSLTPFYAVLDQARRADARAASASPGGPTALGREPAIPRTVHDEPTMGTGLPESPPSESWEVPAVGAAGAAEPAWAAGRPGAPVEPGRAQRRPVAKRRRRSPWPWILLVLVLLGTAGGAVYLLHPEWLPLDVLRLVAPVSVPQGPATGPQTAAPAEPPLAPAVSPTPPATTAAPAAPASEAKPPAVAAAPPVPAPEVKTPGSPAPTPGAPAAGEPPAPSPRAEAPSEGAAPREESGAVPAQPQGPGTAAAAAVPEPAPKAKPESVTAPAPQPAAPAAPAVPGTPKATASARPPEAGTAATATSPRSRAEAPAAAAADRRAVSPARRAKALLADARRMRDRGNPEAALDLYGQVLQLDANSADALAGRGLSYLDLSRYDPAEESFKAALQADPEHGAALMGLAETYRYEGRRADAVTYYRRYLAAHPDGAAAAAARNAVQALEESQ